MIDAYEYSRDSFKLEKPNSLRSMFLSLLLRAEHTLIYSTGTRTFGWNVTAVCLGAQEILSWNVSFVLFREINDYVRHSTEVPIAWTSLNSALSVIS